MHLLFLQLMPVLFCLQPNEVQSLTCLCDRSHFKRRLMELNYMHAIHKYTMEEKGLDDHVNNFRARLYLLNAELDPETLETPLAPPGSSEPQPLPNLPLTQLSLPSILLMDKGDGTCEIDAYGKLYTYDIRPVCTVEVGSNNERYPNVHLGPIDQLNCLGSFGYQCNTTLCNSRDRFDEQNTPACADVNVVANNIENNDRQRNLYHYHRKLGGSRPKSWMTEQRNNATAKRETLDHY